MMCCLILRLKCELFDPGVLHVFNTKEPNVRVVPIKHLGVAGVEFEDETNLPVTGMVRLEKERKITFRGHSLQPFLRTREKVWSDESSVCSPKGYLYESDPDVYTADELGHFEIAITPAKHGHSWLRTESRNLLWWRCVRCLRVQNANVV